jgi:hypothetical protein
VIIQDLKSPRPSSADASKRTSYMGTSQRLSGPTAVIKDGVMFSSISQNVGIGPGHYDQRDTLIKKSFNARASSAKSPRQSTGSAPNTPSPVSPRSNGSARSSRSDLQQRLRDQTQT